jgi:hypothetical protein
MSPVNATIELEAADAAKPEVQDDHARACAPRQLEPGFPGFRHEDAHLREHGFQILPDREPGVRVVFDDHDRLRRARGENGH